LIRARCEAVPSRFDQRSGTDEDLHDRDIRLEDGAISRFFIRTDLRIAFRPQGHRPAHGVEQNALQATGTKLA
jgi:hypothetical protein